MCFVLKELPKHAPKESPLTGMCKHLSRLQLGLHGLCTGGLIPSGANHESTRILPSRAPLLCCMQIADMEDAGPAAKGLYGISKLLDSADQRGAFYGAGGLERMQGILANASISDRVHRKIASLFGDLAMRGEVRSQRQRQKDPPDSSRRVCSCHMECLVKHRRTPA